MFCFPLQHREANRAIFEFLVRFLHMPARRGGASLPLVNSVLASSPGVDEQGRPQCIGQMILQFHVAGALVTLPQSQIDDIVDVIVALAELAGQTRMADWGRGASPSIDSTVIRGRTPTSHALTQPP